MAQSEKHKIKNAVISSEIDARREVARMDMAIGMASIARPLKTGAQRMAFLVKQNFNGGTVTARGTALDEHDLGVLLVLLVIAQQQKNTPKPGHEVEGLLLDSKEPNDACDLDVVTIGTSYSEIRKILGLKSDGFKNSDRIWQSLCNLATIVVDARSDGRMALTHLIKHGVGMANETLSITLSFRLTRALLGQGSYGGVDMKVFRELPRGAVRILYVWMCSFCFELRCQKQRSLNYLVEKVYSQKLKDMSPDVLKNRRMVIRNGLKHIESNSSQLTFLLEKDMVTMQKVTN